MSMTPEEKWEANRLRARQVSDVSKVIELQIRKEMDGVRARLYWQNALKQIPHEVLAEALAMALSSKRFQDVPRCRSCGAGHGN